MLLLPWNVFVDIACSAETSHSLVRSVLIFDLSKNTQSHFDLNAERSSRKTHKPVHLNKNRRDPVRVVTNEDSFYCVDREGRCELWEKKQKNRKRDGPLLQRWYKCCCKKRDGSLCLFVQVFCIEALLLIQMDNPSSVDGTELVSNLLCSFLGEFMETQWTLTILYHLFPAASLQFAIGGVWVKQRRAIFRTSEQQRDDKKRDLLISRPIVPGVRL